jgi:hypothetical protein
LQAAVTRLGLQDVARQAMAASMSSSTTASGPLWSLRCHLWHRSLVRAVVARFLALRRGLSGDEAFLCGLLHSLGSVVGALSLEKLLRGRKGISRQPLSWWARVLEHFRVQLAELAAREWRLVPLFAEAITLHSGTDRERGADPRMLEVVVTASAVTRLLHERRHPTTNELLTAGAREQAEALAKALPDAAPMLAALETRAPSKPTESWVLPERARGLVPLPTGTKVSPVGAPQFSYQVTAIGERAAVLEGEAPLPETVLAALRLVDDPEADLWVLPIVVERTGQRTTIEVAPFALSEPAERRWREWMSAAATAHSA